LATPEGSAKRLELDRVLASPSFAKSPRLCSLLGFIVTHSLKGDHVNLTEQQIGIHVFGRVPGYNSSEDTIVRVTVRQLRQRLDLYYSGEGSRNEFRIDIPKGGYIASLDRQGVGKISAPVISTTLPSGPMPQIPTAAEDVPDRKRSNLVIALLSIAVLVLAVICIVQHRAASVPIVHKGPVALWQALFTPDRKTLIVPGDAALDTFSVWEQRTVPLEAYATHNYDRVTSASNPPSHTDVPLATRSDTPMADLALVAELVRAPEHIGMPEIEKNVEIKYARDVVIADTHDNNLILLGAESFNPWVTLYQSELDFVAHYDLVADTYTIVNKSPKTGEQASYMYRRTKPNLKNYVHIALLKNSQGQGRVLIVEGTSMGATYGALNFLTSSWLYEPVLKQATDSSGHLRDFEVLLSGDFIHGGVGNSRVIAVHVH
jgi:hypothetical protein